MSAWRSPCTPQHCIYSHRSQRTHIDEERLTLALHKVHQRQEAVDRGRGDVFRAKCGFERRCEVVPLLVAQDNPTYFSTPR